MGSHGLRVQYGGPDGLDIDREGNLIAARPGGVNVFSPDGTLLGSIELGIPTSNIAWGNDGSVLYITASDSIYSIKLIQKELAFKALLPANCNHKFCVISSGNEKSIV